MSIEENIQTVKNFFAVMGSGDRQRLLSLVAEDIEWIIPGEDWPLAGTHRGHAGLADLLQYASDEVEMTYPEPPEFVAQGDRVLVVGGATGKIKATNRAFRDDWVFAITVRNGKVTKIREYIDTQALARASKMAATGRPTTYPIRSDTIRCKENGEISMSIEKNVRIVKNFFLAMGRGNREGLLALSAEDIEWIIPGQDWPLAGVHRGHAALRDVLQKASETMETSFPGPPEYVAQGDRVLMIGSAKGRIKATNRAFKDDWVFAITVRDGKVTKIREYIDTQALARASQMDASKLA